ncbi:MAG TPA: ATP-binding cassette domain-containing protein [Spirochaetota bacterium]|nr:ATP-binding cassette domain-containing protein [Spirochaetota bacterium]
MKKHLSNPDDPLLQLKSIYLTYGQANALNNINISFGSSEIHAIVGEHGAGKSSLGMVINGRVRPTSGRIVYRSTAHDSLTLDRSKALGIHMVYQHIQLNENFTVAENLFLTNKRVATSVYYNRKKLRRESADLLERYGFSINPSTPLKELNLSDRALINILKYVYDRSKVLILDESLEKLSAIAFEKVVRILLQMKQNGSLILFITYRIDNIYHFADRVTVLKNGEILLTEDVKEIDKINLVKMAYTQISRDESIMESGKEFYTLLKYNEAILKNLPVNLVVTDNKKQVKLVNRSGKQYFNLKEELYLNRPIACLFSRDNKDTVSLIEEALEGNAEENFYSLPLEMDGRKTVNNIKVLPIVDQSFKIGSIIIIENITERENLRNQMILSEKLASIGLLTAGVAHEINNPLEVIYNHIRYLKYNLPGSAMRKTVDSLEEEIKYISTIVSNLITFSDNNKTVVENFNLNELIESVISFIRISAKAKKIRIEFDGKGKDVQLRTNKNEMKQVILNLLKNSFEAIPRGGKISIDTGYMRQNGRGEVFIVICDTGCGIMEEDFKNIFLPFYSTKQDGNLGLGLSVSYGILKKYNGTIHVENLTPSGCRFSITIPQNPRAQQGLS